NESPSPPAAGRGRGLLARRRVRPVLAAAVVLVCLLAMGVVGYTVIYPQIEAVYHWRQAQRAIDDYDFSRAQAHLRRCLAVWPDSGETQFLMARTCRRAGDLDAARAHLREAKRLHWVEDEVRLESLLMQTQFGAVP